MNVQAVRLSNDLATGLSNVGLDRCSGCVECPEGASRFDCTTADRLGFGARRAAYFKRPKGCPGKRKPDTERKPWSAEEDAVLTGNTTLGSLAVAGLLPGRTHTAVMNRAAILRKQGTTVRFVHSGFRNYPLPQPKGKDMSRPVNTPMPWTDAEDTILREHGTLGREGVSATIRATLDIDRTPSACSNRAHKIGVSLATGKRPDSAMRPTGGGVVAEPVAPLPPAVVEEADEAARVMVAAMEDVGLIPKTVEVTGDWWVCPRCEAGFASEDAMRTHQAEEHMPDKSHSCSCAKPSTATYPTPAEVHVGAALPADALVTSLAWEIVELRRECVLDTMYTGEDGAKDRMLDTLIATAVRFGALGGTITIPEA